MPTAEDLKYYQALPLDLKVYLTRDRIREWINHYGESGVYVSFSGGKDSTVLLDIVRKDYPDVEAVFGDTGLEYPEVVAFVKTFDNVTILRLEKNILQVLKESGYPVISKEVSQTIYEARIQTKNGLADCYRMRKLNGTAKEKNGELSRYNIPQWKFLLDAPFRISHMCCKNMKKKPFERFEKQTGKKAILGMLACESLLRRQRWERYGCNAFQTRRPQSNPLSFWKNNDILTYIHENNLPIASVYGNVIPGDGKEIDGQLNLYDLTGNYEGCRFRTTGCDRTGCMFCLFGAHIEKGEGRLERMKRTHPRRYEYVMGGGEFDEEGMWIPNREGLGFKFVIDWLNKNGNLQIRY